jgi:hypothetical protein
MSGQGALLLGALRARSVALYDPEIRDVLGHVAPELASLVRASSIRLATQSDILHRADVVCVAVYGHVVALDLFRTLRHSSSRAFLSRLEIHTGVQAAHAAEFLAAKEVAPVAQHVGMIVIEMGRLTDANVHALTRVHARNIGIDFHATTILPADALRVVALPGLCRLDLPTCKIGDELAASLCGALIGSASLRYLYLYDNDISDAGAASIAGLSSLPSLHELVLGDNKIGDAGASALVVFAASPSLRLLALDKNAIGNRGAVALARFDACTTLRVLNLDSNPRITRPGKNALRTLIDRNIARIGT